MSTLPPPPGWRQCWAAAASVRRADRGPEARRVARPRSDFVLVSSRVPMALLLWMRARQRMLVWSDPEHFLLLERSSPVSTVAQMAAERDRRREVGHGRWVRLADRLDDQFPAVAVLGTALALMVLAFVVALARILVPHPSPWTFWLPLGLALTAVFWIACGMTAFVVQGGYRLLTQEQRRMTNAETRIGAQLPAVALLHASRPDAAVELLQRALSTLTTPGPRRLLLPARAVSTADARVVIRSLEWVRALSPRGRDLVVGADAGLETPPETTELDWPDLRLVLGASLALVGLLGVILPDYERQSCGSQGCNDGQPITRGAMVYWLITRLVTGGDPNGVGPTSFPNRIIGTLMSVFGVYILVNLVGLILASATTKDRQSYVRVVEAFNADVAVRAAGATATSSTPLRRTAARLGRRLTAWGQRPRS